MTVGAVERGVGTQQRPRADDVDSVRAVLNASATRRFAPRGEPHDPFRSRWATMTGADLVVLTVASSAFSPRTPE